MKNNNFNQIHLIGIAGSGMSGLARLLKEMGYQVSGSDLNPEKISSEFLSKGITVFKGHRKENIVSPDMVIYSSAVKDDNPEIIAAKEKNIKLISRGEMLAEICKNKKVIAVAGTHGKTTTTAMIAEILLAANLNPTIYVGSEIQNLKTNAKLGNSKYFVLESDESDNSFLHLSPYIAVITNIEADHLDFHKNFSALKNSFVKFIKNSQKLVLWGEDNILMEISNNVDIQKLFYGFNLNYDLSAQNIILNAFSAEYDLFFKDKYKTKVKLSVSGKHNVLNSLAALSVANVLKINLIKAVNFLNNFKGTKRRFELKHNKNDILIIDDYAHHPTEIKSTLETAKNLNKKRVIVIYQPHRYSRTSFFLKEIANSFSDSDIIILTEIYLASEKNKDKFLVKKLFNLMKELYPKKQVKFFSTQDEIVKYLIQTTLAGDVVLTLGAGDITKVSDKLASKLKNLKWTME